MTVTDGAIMFFSCTISFILGYSVGVFRFSRFVNRQLNDIKQSMSRIDDASRELQQFYSRVGEDQNNKRQS